MRACSEISPLWLLRLASITVSVLVANGAQTTSQDDIPPEGSTTDDAPSKLLETTSVYPIGNVNISVPKLSNSVTFKCNGTAFQYDLSSSSCIDALTSSLFAWDSPTPKTWGRRNSGVHHDFPLPVRFISVDGTCVVEPVLAPSFTSARASQQQVGIGAFAVINACANGRPSQGGMAIDLGDGGQLAVTVSKQTPSVRCYGNAQLAGIVSSCQSILDAMDVSDRVRSFGNGRGVDVQLPVIMRSADRRCAISLRSIGKTDLFSWKYVWSHAATITAMCAKEGENGIWMNLGLDGHLYLEVRAEGLGDRATS